MCVCECVARIVSKVSKLISVEEEETQVAQGGSGSCGRGSPLELLANHCTRPNGNGQQLSAAPTVNFCFPPPFLMLQIFTWHAVCVCCACVRENFPRFLLDGVNQKRVAEGERQGQGAGTACCICFEGKLSKAFQLCSGFCGTPSPALLRLALLQFSPTAFLLIPLCSCYLPHSMLPSNLAALYHNVKVTF